MYTNFLLHMLAAHVLEKNGGLIFIFSIKRTLEGIRQIEIRDTSLYLNDFLSNTQL